MGNKKKNIDKIVKDNENVWHNDLYSISFTKSGPVIVRTWTNDDTLEKGNYSEMKDMLFTFKEAKDVVVNWYIQRASTLDAMDEDYYNKSAVEIDEENEEEFMKYMDGQGSFSIT